ncbi:hypothetical protein MPL1032_190001 [Mesorhizobium plurifarium]|uniref:Uncharacterized protein n=1 Tax=Mesorhizobium plurifarium TaxID=69974 RepID=A0A0K2VV91_MESPL|nr:hypothetical protein MPL1032_190001 [Mesorhizobium plurifarium]
MVALLPQGEKEKLHKNFIFDSRDSRQSVIGGPSLAAYLSAMRAGIEEATDEREHQHPGRAFERPDGPTRDGP